MIDETVETGEKGFWELMDEATSLGSGAGTICEIEIAFGYKVFVSKAVYDASQWMSFFPYQIGNKKSISDAQKEANKFVVDYGLTSNPQNSFGLRMFKDTILNKKSEWKDDRYAFFPTWTTFYTEVAYPALHDAGIKSLGKMWAKIGWKEDKWAKKQEVPLLDKDKNPVVDELGNPIIEMKFRQQPYVSEVYSSREHAMKENGISDVVSEQNEFEERFEASDHIPEGYDRESWEATKTEIISEHNRGVADDKLAADYGLSLETVVLVVA